MEAEPTARSKTLRPERRGLTQDQLAEQLRPYAEAVRTDENFEEPVLAESFLLIMGWFYAFRCDVFAGAFRRLEVGARYDCDAYHQKQRKHLRACLERGHRNGILLRKDGQNLVAVDWLGKEDDPTIGLGIILDCMVLAGELTRSKNPVDGQYLYQTTRIV